MQTNEPIKLCDAKQWWTVYSTGLMRRSIKTVGSSFAYYEDACQHAEKNRRKGWQVEIKEEKAVEF